MTMTQEGLISSQKQRSELQLSARSALTFPGFKNKAQLGFYHTKKPLSGLILHTNMATS